MEHTHTPFLGTDNRVYCTECHELIQRRDLMGHTRTQYQAPNRPKKKNGVDKVPGEYVGLYNWCHPKGTNGTDFNIWTTEDTIYMQASPKGPVLKYSKCTIRGASIGGEKPNNSASYAWNKFRQWLLSHDVGDLGV